MTIRNQTDRYLYFGIGTSIPPTDSPLFAHRILGEENSCTTHHFHSDAGSVIIRSNRGRRNFETFGNLAVMQISEKDEDGLKIIMIFDKRYGYN